MKKTNYFQIAEVQYRGITRLCLILRFFQISVIDIIFEYLHLRIRTLGNKILRELIFADFVFEI